MFLRAIELAAVLIVATTADGSMSTVSASLSSVGEPDPETKLVDDDETPEYNEDLGELRSDDGLAGSGESVDAVDAGSLGGTEVSDDEEVRNEMLGSASRDRSGRFLKPCWAARGQFPSPKSCAHYLNCWNNKPVEQRCQIGLLFDRLSLRCEDPLRRKVLCGIEPIPKPQDVLPKECGLRVGPKLRVPRIVGGKPSDPYAHPWMAGLEYDTPKGKFIDAGGSLITDRFVLTVAHAMSQFRPEGVKLVSVRLGDCNIKSDEDCVRGLCKPRHIDVRVEKEIPHESFGYHGGMAFLLTNDIGLLKLAQRVKFTAEIQPICLPATSNIPRYMDVIGWGLDGTNGLQPDVLLEVTIPAVSPRDCENIGQRFGGGSLDSRQFCAGGEGGRDTCNSDSGGPLMTYQRDEGVDRRAIVGITSFGMSRSACGIPGVPAVYTKVFSYIDWILKNIEFNSAN